MKGIRNSRAMLPVRSVSVTEQNKRGARIFRYEISPVIIASNKNLAKLPYIFQICIAEQPSQSGCRSYSDAYLLQKRAETAESAGSDI